MYAKLCVILVVHYFNNIFDSVEW